jgi:hypothetical protein
MGVNLCNFGSGYFPFCFYQADDFLKGSIMILSVFAELLNITRVKGETETSAASSYSARESRLLLPRLI